MYVNNTACIYCEKESGYILAVSKPLQRQEWQNGNHWMSHPSSCYIHQYNRVHVCVRVCGGGGWGRDDSKASGLNKFLYLMTTNECPSLFFQQKSYFTFIGVISMPYWWLMIDIETASRHQAIKSYLVQQKGSVGMLLPITEKWLLGNIRMLLARCCWWGAVFSKKALHSTVDIYRVICQLIIQR